MLEAQAENATKAIVRQSERTEFESNMIFSNYCSLALWSVDPYRLLQLIVELGFCFKPIADIVTILLTSFSQSK